MLRSYFNDKEIKVDENGKIFVEVSLKEGVNELKFSAIDKFGNSKDYFLKQSLTLHLPEINIDIPNVYKTVENNIILNCELKKG
jgi:hypothetical protein